MPDLTGGYTVVRTRTDAVPAAERAAYWADHVEGNHGRLGHRFQAPAGFTGWTARQRGMGYQLVEFASDGVGYVRTPRHVRVEPDEDLRMLLPRRGQLRIRTAADAAVVRPGSCAIITFATPFEVRHDRGLKALILTAPDRAVAPALRDRVRSAAVLDLSVGLGAVLAGMVVAIADQRDRLAGGDFTVACARAIELVGSVAIAQAGHAEPAGRASLPLVAAAVRHHVAAHADDPALDGPSAAQAVGWSLRQIQLALRAEGTTPSALIRRTRLDRAVQRLRDPAWSDRSVADVAFASGFTSLSSFGDVVRRHHGCSPRDLRA